MLLKKIIPNPSAKVLAEKFGVSYYYMTRILNFKVDSALAVDVRADAILKYHSKYITYESEK